MDNIRWRIVGVMFLPSIFENRCGDFRRSMWQLSKIDVSPFEDRRSMSRCVDLRRSMIDGRCVGLRRSMVDVKLGCYTAQNIDTIYKLYANYTEGLHFSAFICSVVS